MHKVRLPLLLAATLLFGCVRLSATTPQRPGRPKLIIQITVDQLRGDEPFRYRSRFAARGFRYLMDKGTWYLAANHPHSHTVTAAGHTTLATGAYPAVHGLISDSWFDRATGKRQGSVEDSSYPLVGGQPCTTPLDSDAGDSPRQIQPTTFSDELGMATAGASKVFAVSVKNRAAIPLAGHSGKAFWFCQATGRFVSSTFYYKSYPDWVTNWNRQKLADKFADTSWNLLNPKSTYLFAGLPPLANDLFGFGKTFPHPYGALDQKPPLFYTKLTVSPAGDDLTLQFAEELMEREGLGADDVPDYLALGFSSNDFVGHFFGPSSLESEDVLLRLDRTLERLFAFVDRRVGLRNTLIVLAGDHGAPEAPAYLATLGVGTGTLNQADVQKAAEQALADSFGADGTPKLILSYDLPYIYLDYDQVRQKKLDAGDVARVVAGGVMRVAGVAFAVPSGASARGGEEFDAAITAMIKRNQHPTRSGDVYLVQQPQWQLGPSASSEPPATIIDHGSPWAYDTFVPVVFAGMGVPAAHVSRQIYTVDVAATLAALLRTNQPSGSVGVPLVEVLGQGTPGGGRVVRNRPRAR